MKYALYNFVRSTLLLFILILFSSVFVAAQPPSEKLFKEMITNLPNYQSQPGTNFSLTFNEFSISKPIRWTMEYGNNAGEDKNTKIYKVIARFTLFQETYNTKSGQKYSSSSKEYKRPYNFYIDKTNHWKCVPVGLSGGYY